MSLYPLGLDEIYVGIYIYPLTLGDIICRLTSKRVKSAVILFICIFLSGDRYLGGGANNRRENLHDDRCVIRTDGGDIFRGREIRDQKARDGWFWGLEKAI